MGRVYVVSMIVLNLSAFAIYKFDIAHFVPFRAGPNIFGFFHWLAVAALVFVLVGYYASRHQNRAFWSYVHPIAMTLSYYDLSAAASTKRSPGWILCAHWPEPAPKAPADKSARQ